MFPAPPHLIEKPQDVQKLIDDSLTWECKATGKPKPSYRWMKNGDNLESAEVRSAEHQHVFRSEDKALLLRLGLQQQLWHSCSLHTLQQLCCWMKNGSNYVQYLQGFIVLFVKHYWLITIRYCLPNCDTVPLVQQYIVINFHKRSALKQWLFCLLMCLL